MRKTSQYGFTLMELVIASLLAALVMSAIYTSFSSTILIWRLGEEGIEAYQDARLVLALFSRDLKAIVPNTWDLVEGDSKRLAWFAVRPPFRGTGDEFPRLVRINYFVRPDGTGAYRLFREEQLVLEFLPLMSAGPLMQRRTTDIKLGRKNTVEVCGHVTSLNLEYLWTTVPPKTVTAQTNLAPPVLPPLKKDEPVKEFGIPQVIRVTLGLEDTSSESGRTEFESWVTLPGSLPRVQTE